MILDAQIEEAQNAAVQVRELDDVRETAGRLPYLLAQQQAAKDREEAEKQLVAAKKRAGAIIEATIPRAKDWRARLELVTLELVELIDEVPGLQTEIHDAAKSLSYAAYALDEVTHAPGRNFGQGQTGLESAMPTELGAHPGGISETWRMIGGLDPALDLLPVEQTNSVAADISAVVRKRVKSGVYNASLAHAILRR